MFIIPKRYTYPMLFSLFIEILINIVLRLIILFLVSHKYLRDQAFFLFLQRLLFVVMNILACPILLLLGHFHNSIPHQCSFFALTFRNIAGKTWIFKILQYLCNRIQIQIFHVSESLLLLVYWGLDFFFV